MLGVFVFGLVLMGTVEAQAQGIRREHHATLQTTPNSSSMGEAYLPSGRL